MEIVDNDALTSLNGLSSLGSIGQNFRVDGNINLISFAGVESLENIGMNLIIYYNPSLVSFAGLESLNYIEYALNVQVNDALTSIASLSHLNIVEGEIRFWANNSLNSLIGLDNIKASNLDHLYLVDNSSLSTCDVESICDYLANSGSSEIDNNAVGCNTRSEVEAACGIGINEINLDSEISIYPNPSNKSITIELTYKIKEINIYNHLGQQVLHQQGNQNTINISSLGKEMYIVEILGEDWRVREKLIKQ